MIDKLKARKEKRKSDPFTMGGLEVEEARVPGGMMNYWTSVHKREDSGMKREWDGGDRRTLQPVATEVGGGR